MRKAPVALLVVFFLLASSAAQAQDHIPSTSGFSGFAHGGITYWSVASNLLVGGTPMVLSDVGQSNIPSIYSGPSANNAFGVAGGGELNYTFSSSKTQLYIGNRLEDLLRMDLIFGIGVRQQIGEAGILAASYLTTPADLQFWSDPYIEGEDRTPTGMDFPGFRLRWGSVLGTGLELTLDDRFFRFESERSGEWLVNEGRLDPADQPLLNRKGDILRVQALYRLDVAGQRFEPAVRWVRDFHEGDAIANSGPDFQLTYFYVRPSVILDINLYYGYRQAKAENPIYLKRAESHEVAFAISAFVPFKRYSSSVLSAFATLEIFDENSNIDFYDSQVSMFALGLLWRHQRP